MSHSNRHVFVVLPAMGVPARYYDRLAETLAVQTGGHAEPGPLLSEGGQHRLHGDFGYREVAEGQIPAIVKAMRRRFPRRPVVLCGHSLGGQLALLASGLMRDPPDALVLLAAGTAHHRSWPAAQRRRARLVVHLISLAARVWPWYPGRRLGFGGDQPRRLMRDWSYNATTGRYRFEGSAFDEQAIAANVARLRIPVLSIGFEGDRIAPEGARDELLALAPHADIRRLSIQLVDAGGPWRRHFQWARRPEPVVRSIAQWLGDVPASEPARHIAASA